MNPIDAIKDVLTQNAALVGRLHQLGHSTATRSQLAGIAAAVLDNNAKIAEQLDHINQLGITVTHDELPHPEELPITTDEPPKRGNRKEAKQP